MLSLRAGKTTVAMELTPTERPRTRAWRSLSARLLMLTIAFVMLSEVLIYVPSIARFRQNWYLEKLEAAYLASLALLAAPENMVDPDLETKLLAAAGAQAVMMKQPDRRVLMLSDRMPQNVAASYDIADESPWVLIRDVFATMAMPDETDVLIRGVPRRGQEQGLDVGLEVVLPVGPLKAELFAFSGRILTLSIVISLVTGTVVFFSLHRMMVQPLRRLTRSMTAFREAPEDGMRVIEPSGRTDEIGVAEAELAAMQQELRAAMTRKARLAALGEAMSKVNHDLRNILATAQIVSDRLADSEEPAVRRLTPRLIDSIGRAITLCTTVLSYGRAEEPPLKRSRFALARLVDEVESFIDLPEGAEVRWINNIAADLFIEGDRDQLFRALLNLARNAGQAMTGEGEIRFDAVVREGRVVIEIADSGQGIPDSVRNHLFEPFRGRGRPGGSGLGLAIAREMLRAHGGDLTLARSGPLGTTFRLELPDYPG